MKTGPVAAPSIEIIIPARDAAELIGECIDSVTRQIADGDVLTVVDDASADETAEIAERHGARVLRMTARRGPYGARQSAGMASEADVLVFLDARCRVKDGWLESHRDAMRRDDVALSCSEVVAVASDSLASRVAARQQPFRLQATVPDGDALPYYPTCNLGVRASAFREVGGFAEVRSGGDADLCWRIQRAGLGRLAVDNRRLVQWIPRDSLRALAEQWRRYGLARAVLDSAVETSAPAGQRCSALAAVRAARSELRGALSDPLVGVLTVLMYGLQWWSYRSEMRRRLRQARR
jgi:glycosyltransferase involved in cell wall biosynthesis